CVERCASVSQVWSSVYRYFIDGVTLDVNSGSHRGLHHDFASSLCTSRCRLHVLGSWGREKRINEIPFSSRLLVFLLISLGSTRGFNLMAALGCRRFVLAVAEQRLDEVRSNELAEIFCPLAEPDVANGHFELVAHAEHDTALRRSIELRQNDSRELEGLFE